MIEKSETPEALAANEAFDKLHLGIFDENDAERFLGSSMLRMTFGADYAARIDFTDGDVLRTVLQAVDVVSDTSVGAIIRAKAQLLLDAVKISQVELKNIGTLGQYIEDIQKDGK